MIRRPVLLVRRSCLEYVAYYRPLLCRPKVGKVAAALPQAGLASVLY